MVFPKGNENLFIEMAVRLGIEKIAFAYEFSGRGDASAIKSEVEKFQKDAGLRLAVLFEAEEKGIYKVHDFGERAIAKGSLNSRETIARYRPDFIYDLELSESKDFAKFRNSGLDKATCQFAKKYGVTVVFSFSSLLNASDFPQLLGRMIQNFKLCKKYDVKTSIASLASSPAEMRGPHDLKSFLLSMGMYSGSAKKSLESASEVFG